jgi:hypothetical protein
MLSLRSREGHERVPEIGESYILGGSLRCEDRLRVVQETLVLERSRCGASIHYSTTTYPARLDTDFGT